MTAMRDRIILASASPIRRSLLANAGVTFTVDTARIDERQVEAELPAGHRPPDALALALAEAKARDVSARHPGAVVIGCDQTLSFRGEVLHKCFDRAAARERLMAMAGATHELNSAFALVRDGALIDQHVAIARLTMRPFGDAFIDTYLDQAGGDVLASVAAYQIEGRGIQLFEAIDGDYFTIAGLPLLPLLAALRDLGAIDA